MRSFMRFFCLMSLLLLSFGSRAAIDVHEFDNDQQRQRYQSFIEEMRCPKCQNQNLAGSDSPISADLRREIYDMIKAGKSDKEIVDFMVDRYGDFILYRPRVTAITYVLWGAPAVLLVTGTIILILMLRRRRRLALDQKVQPLSDDEQARLVSLLNSTPDTSSSNKNTSSSQQGQQ